MMTPIDMMIWFLVLLIMITIFLFMFCTKNDSIEDDRDAANNDVEEVRMIFHTRNTNAAPRVFTAPQRRLCYSP